MARALTAIGILSFEIRSSQMCLLSFVQLLIINYISLTCLFPKEMLLG